VKKPPPGLVTSRSKPPRRPHPHHHPHPQRHHPGGGRGVRVTNPLLPGRPLPAHRHKAPKHKKAKKPVRRKLALGEGVACCSAEALAASLRLAGVPVGDEDVLALYWRTAADADAGATISATLEAASEFGLAGVRLVSFDSHAGNAAINATRDVLTVDDLDRAALAVETQAFPPVGLAPVLHRPVRQAVDSLGHPPIIGVTLPGGPHALTLDPSGAVWSWGGLYDPGDLEIEEAWLVDWEV
jgi:hypothetical protein